MTTMEDRLEKIESKLSLSEDAIDELNRTVYRQQMQIDQLQRDVAALREQVRAALPHEERILKDEIPPHY